MGIDKALGTQCLQEGNMNYYAVQDVVSRWINAYPDSPAARIAYSMALIDHGWSFRGCGYSNTVSADDRKSFDAYIDAAYQNLITYKYMATIDPMWYQMMLTVAYAKGWDKDEFYQVYKEAVTKEPYYYQTYFTAAEYLMPKWYGDIKQIEELAQDAVNRTKSQEGMGMYARIYWYVSSSSFETDLFTKSMADWSNMKSGFEDILKRYPDTWNSNNYARFACMAEDRGTAKDLMSTIGNEPIEQAWQPISLFSKCQQWINKPYIDVRLIILIGGLLLFGSVILIISKRMKTETKE